MVPPTHFTVLQKDPCKGHPIKDYHTLLKNFFFYKITSRLHSLNSGNCVDDNPINKDFGILYVTLLGSSSPCRMGQPPQGLEREGLPSFTAASGSNEVVLL